MPEKDDASLTKPYVFAFEGKMIVAAFYLIETLLVVVNMSSVAIQKCHLNIAIILSFISTFH